jgi:chromate transport protein ChrA
MNSHRLAPFLRASSLHIGAAAAAASLRHDLVKEGKVESRDIDAAYAISRVTPGTNLLALYALLGHRLGGWSPVALVAWRVPVSLFVVLLIAGALGAVVLKPAS